MKRKRLYIWGGIATALVVLGWLAYANLFGIMGFMRDMHLGIKGFEHHSLKTDSTEIAYYRGGSPEKKKILFLHGFGMGGGFTWYNVMTDMSDEMDFIVPDLMWFGDSKGKVDPTLPNQARAMWELCDSLKIMPDAIVGISYGGFVAFEMMHQRPQANPGLILVNSPGPVFREDDITALCTRAKVKSPDELFVPRDVDGVKHLFQFVFHGAPPMPDFMYGQIFDNEIQKDTETRRALMKDLVGNAQLYRSHGILKGSKNMVVWSKNDQVFPLACGQELADSLHCNIVVMEKSGHVPDPDDRPVYMGALRDFLK